MALVARQFQLKNHISIKQTGSDLSDLGFPLYELAQRVQFDGPRHQVFSSDHRVTEACSTVHL